MWLRRISIFGVSLLIAHGCATIPQQDLAERMTSSGCDKVSSLAIESGFFEVGEWPQDTWWESFDDSALNQLIAKGLENSPTLQRAEARLKLAAQVALQRKARLYPEIDLDADTNWQHLSRHGLYREFGGPYPPVINQVDLGFSFSYEFDFWGKNRDLFQAALGKAAATLAEKKQAELILTTSIAYTYFQVQFLLRKLDILEQLEDNQQKILDITSRRETHALATAFDRLSASSMTCNVKEEMLSTEQLLRIELHKLKALTALGQDAIIELSWKPLKDTLVALPTNLSLDLLSRRPDLTAQTLRVDAAAKEIGAAKTDFYPNINLMGILGLESIPGSTLFRRDSFNANIEPALHLPIFTAGRLKAQLFEKVEAFDEAVYAYNELLLQAAQEVTDSLTSIALLKKQITTHQSILDDASQKVQLTAERVQYALDNQLSLLKAQNVSLEEELALTQLNYSRQLVVIQLIRALGGGYHYE
ncbi:MAG: efflux transporter outer membrane subunit [Simkania sp.]|nr:efflux transporter outer membrane subunit [Simkania sp.]